MTAGLARPPPPARGAPPASPSTARGRAAATTAARGRALPLPVLLYFLLLLLPVTFNLGPLFMTGVRAFLVVMIVPLLIRLFLGHFGRILITDVLFILHIAWAAVALQVTSPAQMLTQVGSVGPEFLGGYLLGRAYVRDRASFIAVCKALLVAVLITLPFALYETRTGRPMILETLRQLPVFSSFADVNIPARLGLQRVQGMTPHPIHYGLFASSALALTMVGLRGVLSDTQRLLAVAGVTVCTFLSLSSGALLPMVMQLFLYLWARLFDRTGRPWLILVGLAIIAYVAVDLLSNRSPVRVFFSYATFSAHNAYWRGIIFEWGLANVIGSAEKGIAGSPWVGIGMNPWVRPAFMHSGSMDNFWLVMTVRYGLPGFAFLAAGYLIAMARIGARRFAADPELARLRMAWMFVFVGITFALCTVHVWGNVYSFVFFLFGAGIWFIVAEPQGSGAAGDTPEAPGAGPDAGPPPAAGPRFSRFPAAPRRAA